MKRIFSTGLLVFALTFNVCAQQHASPEITDSTITHFTPEGRIYLVEKINVGVTDSLILYFPWDACIRLKVDSTKTRLYSSHYEIEQTYLNSPVRRTFLVDTVQQIVSDIFRGGPVPAFHVVRNLPGNRVHLSWFAMPGKMETRNYYSSGELWSLSTNDSLVQYFRDGRMKQLQVNGQCRKSWHANGKLASYEKLNVSGGPDSVSVFYNSDGSLLRRIDHVHNTREGDFYPNGQLMFKSRKGKMISYYDNGQRRSGYFRLGRWTRERNFYHNGKVESKGWKRTYVYYRDLKCSDCPKIHRRTKKKGKWKYYDAQGRLIAKGKYANDQKAGRWRYYDGSGRLYEFAVDYEHFPVRDNFTGPDTAFVYNGPDKQVSAIRMKKNGALHGEFIEYDMQGKVQAQGYYQFNRLSGTSWRMKGPYSSEAAPVDSSFADPHGNLRICSYGGNGQQLIEIGMDSLHRFLYTKTWENGKLTKSVVGGHYSHKANALVNAFNFHPDSVAKANLEQYKIPGWFHVDWVADTATASAWHRSTYFGTGYIMDYPDADFNYCYFIAFADSSLTQPMFEGAITGGKKNGTWTYYYDNGQIKARGNYRDDLYTGEWRSYYRNGDLMMITNYKIVTVYPAHRKGKTIFKRKEYCEFMRKYNYWDYDYFEKATISVKDGYFEYRHDNRADKMIYKKGKIVARPE